MPTNKDLPTKDREDEAALTDDPIPTKGGLPAKRSTYEIQAAPAAPATRDATALAHGASSLRLTKDEDKLLGAKVEDRDVEIRPDGIVYLSHAKLRAILNEALGRGQWCMVPQGDPLLDGVNHTVSRVYHLYVRGCFMKEAMGEQEYHPSSPTMSYADALEGAESNALTRCCKALGIALELWDKGWIEKWKPKMAIAVYVKKRNGEVKKEWRLKTRDPLPGEQGAVKENGGNGAPSAVGGDKPTNLGSARPVAATTSQPSPRAGTGTDPDKSVAPSKHALGDGVSKVILDTKGGKKLAIEKHADWNSAVNIGDNKIGRMVVIALNYAKNHEGLSGDAGAEWAHRHLNEMAASVGAAHYSLIPWKGSDYDNVVAAFEGGEK